VRLQGCGGGCQGAEPQGPPVVGAAYAGGVPASVFSRRWLSRLRRAREPQLFELLAPSRTGVTFANRLPDDTAFNILTTCTYYDGGGVAAGDVNNDGLPDLYFTSNVGPNRLY